MKKYFYTVILGLLCFTSFGQRITYDTTFQGWKARVTYDPNADSTEGIITHPGLGEIQSQSNSGLQAYGPHYWLNNGWDGSVTLGNGIHYPIFVTLLATTSNPLPTVTKEVLDAVMGRYKIKRNSVHLAGFSQGGWIFNAMLCYEPTNGDSSYFQLAKSMTSMSGVPVGNSTTYGATIAYPQRFGRMVKHGGPHYFLFQQYSDGVGNVTGLGLPFIMRDEMNDSLSGSANYIWTRFGDLGHCCWNEVYDPFETNWTSSNTSTATVRAGEYSNYPTPGGQNLFQLMLRQGDTSNATANILPVADAGSDTTIQLPTSSITLNGSGTDSDGAITSYLWEVMSGAGATIVSPTTSTTLVTGLTQGIYRFKLTVTDNNSSAGTAEVQITVLAAPVPDRYINVNFETVNPATSKPYYTNPQWNSWIITSALETNLQLPILKYSNGDTSTISASLSRHEQGVTNLIGSGGFTAYPDSVARVTSVGKTTTRVLTISGLDDSKLYDLSLYSYRSTGTDQISRFTIGGVIKDVLSSLNKTGLVKFEQLSPVSGQIIVNMNSVDTYSYLNGFGLTELGSEETDPSSISDQPFISGTMLTSEPTTSIEVYPNPLSDNFTLQVRGNYSGDMLVQLLEVNGRLKKEFKVNKKQELFSQNFSLSSDFKPGIYLLKIVMGKKINTVKFIKL